MRYIAITYMLVCSIYCPAQINIWEGTDVHKKVELTPYLAEGDNNPAIVVCPGGSYFWHDIKTEGHDVAKWLQSNGISAFVLRYRVGYVPAFIFRYRYLFRGNRYPDPQNDLRKAIRVIKENHEKYKVDIQRIGAMGFSAGGHLVMSAAEFFEGTDKPAFVVPVYPVVTMVEECVHKRSRRGLLGDNKKNDRTLQSLLSLEKNVPQDCPPVFLINCKDDPIVDFHNSELLDSALTANNILHKYVQYKTGGHGFGVSDKKGTIECRSWKEEFLNWFDKFIK